MPATIRQTLLGRLQASRELADLENDLKVLAGLKLRLVDPLAQKVRAAATCSNSRLCTQIHHTREGGEQCDRFANRLVLPTPRDSNLCHTCHAGLTSIRSPIRLAGETIGYLVAGAFSLAKASDSSSEERGELPNHPCPKYAPHLSIDPSEAVPPEPAPAISEAKYAALQRWLQLAADSLVHGLEFRDHAPGKPLPSYINKICAVIQRDYQHPPSLSQAAKICGLSKGYFCRAFHEFTGLRFVEYIQAVRIDHVCQLLERPDCSISEAAFASGFQSLSQFNRAFRKLKGTSPRNWRKIRSLATKSPETSFPLIQANRPPEHVPESFPQSLSTVL